MFIIWGKRYMKILLVSSEHNSKKLINDSLRYLDFELEINVFSSETDIKSFSDWDYHMVVLDDSEFINFKYDMKAFVFSKLLEMKLATVVLLKEVSRIDAYIGLNLLDYFIPPYDQQRFQIRINAMNVSLDYKSENTEQKNKFVIKNRNEVLLVNYDQIIFFEKDGKKMYIHLKDKVMTMVESLKRIELELPSEFVRVHNSYIVNSKHIQRIREVSNRSYEIDFLGYKRIAHMSRYKSGALLDDYEKLGPNTEIIKVHGLG